MSSVIYSSRRAPLTSDGLSQRGAHAHRLNWAERGLLGLGIFEIPLEIDKYYLYQEADADLGAVGGFNISVTLLCLIALYGIWIVTAANRRLPTMRKVSFGIPMIVYLGAIALSVFSAGKPLLSLCDLWLVGQSYLLFFFIANRVRTVDDVMFCVLVLAATIFTQSLFIFLLTAAGIDDQEISIGPLMLTVWAQRRQAGTMHSPVLAGSTLALIWLPVASAAISARLAWMRNVLLVASGCGLLAILLTQTRGAILTCVVGCIIIGIGLSSRGWLPRWTLGAAVVAAMVSIVPLYNVYEKRIREGDGDSAIARKHMSLIAMDMIAERPLFGYGAGNCHLAGLPFANQARWRSEWYYTIHSKYLLTWIETGIIGFVAFICLIVTGLYHAWSTWFSRDRDLAPLGLALAAALHGHSLHLAVDIFNSRIQVQILWTILGLAAATYGIVHSRAGEPGRKLSRSLSAGRWRYSASHPSAGGATR